MLGVWTVILAVSIHDWTLFFWGGFFSFFSFLSFFLGAPVRTISVFLRANFFSFLFFSFSLFKSLSCSADPQYHVCSEASFFFILHLSPAFFLSSFPPLFSFFF